MALGIVIFWIMEKKMEATVVYLGYIRNMALGIVIFWIMEKKMEATVVYLGYIRKMALGIVIFRGNIRTMERNMGATIVYLGYRRNVALGRAPVTQIVGSRFYIPCRYIPSNLLFR